MSLTRQVVVQVISRPGDAANHVEFTFDDAFAERLDQLRAMVPPLTALTRQRDLVIDKLRVRLPSAIWRCGGPGEAATPVDGSSIVVAAEGYFNCGAKTQADQKRLVTYPFPIARLIELHQTRPAGEVFFLRNGIFTNDEPPESNARRWSTLLHAQDPAPSLEPPTGFDTVHGVPLQLPTQEREPAAERRNGHRKFN